MAMAMVTPGAMGVAGVAGAKVAGLPGFAPPVRKQGFMGALSSSGISIANIIISNHLNPRKALNKTSQKESAPNLSPDKILCDKLI